MINYETPTSLGKQVETKKNYTKLKTLNLKNQKYYKFLALQLGFFTY